MPMCVILYSNTLLSQCMYNCVLLKNNVNKCVEYEIEIYSVYVNIIV